MTTFQYVTKAHEKYLSSPYSHLHLSYRQQLDYVLKVKEMSKIPKVFLRVKKDILILDNLSFQENSKNVERELGSPFYVYRKKSSSDLVTIFTYGLKSGDPKAKFQLYFHDDRLVFCLVQLHSHTFKHAEINSYIYQKFDLPYFNILTDVILDKHKNFIEFFATPGEIIMCYSSLDWKTLSHME